MLPGAVASRGRHASDQQGGHPAQLPVPLVPAGWVGVGRDAMTARAVEVRLGAFGWRIAFVGCEQEARGFAGILTGWDAQLAWADQDRPADVTIWRHGEGYRWRSATLTRPLMWRTRPPLTRMEAICDVHDALFDWYLARRPGHLCLHAGAVRIGGALVVFPSVGKAGKSTLVTELAARGHQVLCDDVLPIEPRRGSGVALGIAPRLRRPLPVTVGADFRAFVERRAGPRNRYWMYVCLAEGEIAPLGAEHPIEGLVLLARQSERCRARLEPISRTEILSELILQDFADGVPAAQRLDRLIAIVETARCYRLRYHTTSSAARALEGAFGRAEHESARGGIERRAGP